MFNQLVWKHLVGAQSTPTAKQARLLGREIRFVAGLFLSAVAAGTFIGGPAALAGVGSKSPPSDGPVVTIVPPAGGGGSGVEHPCGATAPNITDPIANQILAAVSDTYTPEQLAAGLDASIAWSGLPTDPASLEWTGLTGDRCADMQKVLNTPPAITLAAQTGVNPAMLLILDNEASEQFGGPPVEILTPLSFEPTALDEHSCFQLGLIQISGPNGTAQAIAGIVSGTDPWGQPRSMSIPVIDITMLQLADPELLPPVDLGGEAPPEQWWAGLLEAFTESTDQHGCLQRCWACDDVCGVPTQGMACVNVTSGCPGENAFDVRYNELAKKKAKAIAEAEFWLSAQIAGIVLGVLACVGTIFGLGAVGAAIAKTGQALTPSLLGPAANALEAGGATSLGGVIGLTAAAFLGIIAFAAGTGLFGLVLGAAAIAACVASGLYLGDLARKSYLAAVEKAKAEYAADVAELLFNMCSCSGSTYAPPKLSCIGAHFGGLGRVGKPSHLP